MSLNHRERGFCSVLVGRVRCESFHLLSHKKSESKEEMSMLSKLFVVALFLLGCWTSSSQAADHHPMMILLDDPGKQLTVR
jgi:hypothetical protein